MENCCRGSNTEPTTEVYIDKLIKYVVIPILSFLGIISLVMLYLVDKVSCYPYYVTSGSAPMATDERIPKADEHCWNSFKNAYQDGGLWVNKETLPHKYFPIIILCEAISLAFPLIFWYWCYSRRLRDNVSSFFDLCNSTTELYRKYDRGLHRLVTVAMLHTKIEQYLEFIAAYLMTQGRSVFNYFIIKWLVLVCMNCAWFVGLFLLHFPKMTIFEEQFHCLYVDNGKTLQRVAECNISTTSFLRAVWYINACMTGLLIIILILYIADLCRPRDYMDSFLYTAVPGSMDSRLATCIHQFYDSRDIALFSRFCDINSFLCKDIGLSRALAREYGITEGLTPGRETIIDKHFPVIQPDQINKFRFSSELFYLRVKKRSEVTFKENKDRKKNVIGIRQKNKISDQQSGKSPGRRRRAIRDNTVYLTPRLLARKIDREMNITRDNPTWSDSPPTDRSIRSKLTLEDLEFDTSTPLPHVPRSYGNREYDEIYEPKDRTRLSRKHQGKIQPYPTHKPRIRELDPYTHRLQKYIMRQKAENNFIWK